ncbi:MAG: hypothetical protein ACLFWF_06950 [Alphaproteobacteria bacterium]
MTTILGNLSRHLFVAAVTWIFATFSTGAAVAAENCKYEPETDEERRACFRELCTEEGSVEETSSMDYNRCTLALHQDWQVIDHCQSSGEEERCIRLARFKKQAKDVIDKVTRHQTVVSALETVRCLKEGGEILHCMGAPPKFDPEIDVPGPDPGPYLISDLRQLSPNERGLIHKRLRRAAKARYEAELFFLKQTFSEAGKKAKPIKERKIQEK